MMKNTSLAKGLGDAVKIERLERRLEMLWIFNTHDGTTSSCGLGNSSTSTPNPDLPNF